MPGLKEEMQALTTKHNASEKAAAGSLRSRSRDCVFRDFHIVQAGIATEKDKGKFLIPIYPVSLLTFCNLSVSTKENDSLKLQIATLKGTVKSMLLSSP